MRYKVSDPESFVATTIDSTADALKKNNSGNVKKSKKENTLIVLVILLIIALMVVCGVLYLQNVIFPKSQNIREICPTKLCVDTAVRVLNSMDNMIKPCDDFYEFACRGWITKNPIPRNVASWNPMRILRSEVTKNLQKILNTPDKATDGKPIKLARAFYRTCLDRKSVEDLGLKPLHDSFKKVGLPGRIPTDEEAEELDMAMIAGKVQRYNGLDIFVDIFIRQDIMNNTRNRLKMQKCSPSFDDLDIYLRDPVRFKNIVNAQRHYVKEMMKLAGAGKKSEEYTIELMDFMTKIAEIMDTEERKVYDITIEQFQELTDITGAYWNWTTYLDHVFKQSDVILDPAKDTVIVFDFDYFKAVPLLLNETSPGTLARYMWWEVYASVAPHTTQKYRDLKYELRKVVYNIKTRNTKKFECTILTNDYFGMALSAVYVEEHFNVYEKKKALQMWNTISTSFDEMLKELKWMDDKTKFEAQRKLHAMRPFIGFPEWITNPQKLEKHYEGIKVFEGRLFDTRIHYNFIEGTRTLNSLRQIPDRNAWVALATRVNAFYNPLLNSATFPAAILHRPLYGNGIEALNYGAIGAVMGHELTHGFDNDGRKFDEKGQKRQWWSKNTLKLFLKKIDCMIDQYTGFKVTQLGNNFTVDGKKTQGENIADNGGLREAFRAYETLKAKSKPQQALPGLVDYTDEQLFFLGFAQMECGSATDGALKSTILKDEHSPNRFRVIGTLQNNAEFAKAWKCPRGSPMNPKHKCIVW